MVPAVALPVAGDVGQVVATDAARAGVLPPGKAGVQVGRHAVPASEGKTVAAPDVVGVQTATHGADTTLGPGQTSP